MLLRWKLNMYGLGDGEARALGLDVARLRLVIIVCSTVLTATSVSVSGMIGWVGLVIPHLARMITGPNYKTSSDGIDAHRQCPSCSWWTM